MSEADMITVGVVGLGNMGLGMARVLAGKGCRVIGCDTSAERSKLAADAGVATAPLVEVAARCSVVILSLPLAKHVEAVTAALVGGLSPGAVIVDTSTSEVDVSRGLARVCCAKGIGFLDAPVSGGPAGANAGTLTMMIGGDAAHLAAARPVLDRIATKVLHVGPSGAGNVAKLVNNLLVAAHLLTVSEGMRLAEAAGVPAGDVLAVVNAASGRSAISEVNYPRWIHSGTFDSGFTMGLMRKDVRLAAELANSAGVALPMSELAAAIWAQSRETLADGEDFNRIVEQPCAPGSA